MLFTYNFAENRSVYSLWNSRQLALHGTVAWLASTMPMPFFVCIWLIIWYDFRFEFGFIFALTFFAQFFFLRFYSKSNIAPNFLPLFQFVIVYQHSRVIHDKFTVIASIAMWEKFQVLSNVHNSNYNSNTAIESDMLAKCTGAIFEKSARNAIAA